MTTPAHPGDLPPSASVHDFLRAELYLRAEKCLREFFSEHLDRLCAACGATATRTEKHLCCCLGVDCLKHIALRPVLLSIVDGDPALANVIAAHVREGESSLLGPTGCALAWGRPPACNTCVCSRQTACLKAALPAQGTVALVRALRVCYDLADPSVNADLNALHSAVEGLEERVRLSSEALRTNAAVFAQAIDEQVALLEQLT